MDHNFKRDKKRIEEMKKKRRDEKNKKRDDKKSETIAPINPPVAGSQF
jgi:hypothetical protein